MSDAVHLPPIGFWQTRSFWLCVGSVLAPLARYAGLDVLPAEFAEYALNVVSLVLLALAYRERANPQRRVVARMPKEGDR